MKNFLILLLACLSLSASAAVENPLYEVAQVEDKYGLCYNGEICVYPIFDEIDLVEPFRQFWDQGQPYKVVKQQMHEITVADKQKRPHSVPIN